MVGLWQAFGYASLGHVQLKTMNGSVKGLNPEHPVSLLMWTQSVAAPGVCAELGGLEPGL